MRLSIADLAGKAKAKTAKAETLGKKGVFRVRIRLRPLAGGGAAWRACWYEPKPGGGYTQKARQFATRGELQDWFDAEETRHKADAKLLRQADSRGDSVVALANLSPAERAAMGQAVEAFRKAGDTAKILSHFARAADILREAGGHPAAIVEAARFYASTHLHGAKRTVAEIVAEHLKAVGERRRPATLADRRRNLAPLVTEYGGELAAGFTTARAEDWIFDANTLSMQAARRRALHAVFAYAERRGYCERNPVAKAEKIEPPPRGEVSILSPQEVAAVLSKAAEIAPALVPYLAIGMFAGLRPMNELAGLDWKDIDLVAGTLSVSRASSKTARARLVPISPNLAAWLDAVPKARRKGIVFYSRRVLRDVLDKARVERGRSKRRVGWGQDIMRHTRTSYRLAQTKDAALVAMEGGHTPEIMKLHYANQTISDADVKAFWAIMPGRAKGGAIAARMEGKK